MAIRFNIETGQGTYADGTPFEMGDIRHGMSKPVAVGEGLHPEADARLAAATGGQPLRVEAWIGTYGTALATYERERARSDVYARPSR